MDKLKARMSRWQAYVDRPQTHTLPQPGEPHTKEIDDLPLPAAQTIERPLPPLLPEAAVHVSGRGTGRSQASPSDPLHDLQEARITDLQSAIVREREQSERLADEVLRAQTLHAATIYAHLQEERSQEEEHIPAQRLMPEMQHRDYEGERRKNLARVIGLLLAITSVLIVTFFATR